MKIDKKMNGLLDEIKKVFGVLDGRQCRKSVIIFIMMIIASLLDTLGVAVILPFINALTNTKAVSSQWYSLYIIELFHLKNDTQFMLFLGCGIVALYVFKNIFLWLYQVALVKFQSIVEQELAVRMLKSYLARPYSFFRNTNSSVIIRGLETDMLALSQCLQHFFTLLTQLLTVCMIVFFLIRQDALMAIGMAVAGFLCLIIIFSFQKTKVSNAGSIYWESTNEKNKSIYQTINGIKEIFVMHREKFFIDAFESAYDKTTFSRISKGKADSAPIRIIETIFVLFVIGIVCIKMLSGIDSYEYVPQLALFAVAGFRLIPLLTGVPSSLNMLIFYREMVNEVYENIIECRNYKIKMENNSFITSSNNKNNKGKLLFNDAIELRNICFKYEDGENDVINNLSLTINKGESVGIIGESGSGKSTVADMLMGLLVPNSGKIEVDGVDIFSDPYGWSKIIGYIPQMVYLLDDTVAANVTFGLRGDEISEKDIWRALDQAYIGDFIRKLPDGLDTIVGEKGVKLSGGQRQRIAIARTLFYNPSIIIMDEATSALDNETEAAVMESINELSKTKTIIIIAHRLSTIKECDKVYEIKDGIAIEKSNECIKG